MSKINTTFGLLSRTGLVLSSAVVLCVAATAIQPVSAQELQVKFDGKEFQLKKNSIRTQNPVIGNTKGDREEGGSGKKVFPQVAIGKGDTEDGGSGKKRFPRIAIGKGDRDEDKPKTAQIVIGKGDQAEDNEPPKKRQVIVEPKPKKKVQQVVFTEPVAKKKVKKVVVAKAEEPAKKLVIADAAPAEEEAPAETPEVDTETPVDESTTEAPAEGTTTDEQAEAETPAAPEQKFEVGQIVTGADGKSYVIVKIDDTGISAMPLAAFAEYEQPKKVYKKKRKKRYSSYGYSSSRSYGGSSCH